MPELPEIIRISSQMCEAIADKTVINATCAQPKCPNVSPGEFSHGAEWNDTALLIHLGMGGNLVYRAPNDPLPAKWQLRIDFADHSGFTCRPWWFGYFHIAQLHRLDDPPMVGALGPSPLDEAFTLEIFRTLVRSRHGCVKAFLLDQRNISGIENAYSHDVLFAAGIHPQRQLSSLADSEVAALYSSILSVLKASVDLGGASYELDFYGHPGGFTEDKLLVGYAAALSRRSKPVAPIHLSVHHASPYRHGISDHHDPTQI